MVSIYKACLHDQSEYLPDISRPLSQSWVTSIWDSEATNIKSESDILARTQNRSTFKTNENRLDIYASVGNPYCKNRCCGLVLVTYLGN